MINQTTYNKAVSNAFYPSEGQKTLDCTRLQAIALDEFDLDMKMWEVHSIWKEYSEGKNEEWSPMKGDIHLVQVLRNFIVKHRGDGFDEPDNYVTPERLVRLSPELVTELGLEDGGGISFIKNKDTGRYELWTAAELDSK